MNSNYTNIQKVLYEYKNGNYTVKILSDGTKIRESYKNRNFIEFNSDFPENINLKITNKCTGMECVMCSENSTFNGEHGDINVEFLKTLQAGTEVTIDGGNPLEHPHLDELLNQLKESNVITNIIVNQAHFMQEENFKRLKKYQEDDLITGLGVSLTNPTREFIKKVKLLDNVVIHVILGYHTYEMIKKLFDSDLRVLFLGYKYFGRGEASYYNLHIKSKIKKIYDELDGIFSKFEIISFDNLALEQLEVRRFLTKEQWDMFYLGDDGTFTFYVDLVTKKFAKNSTSKDRYDLKDDIVDMFEELMLSNLAKVKTERDEDEDELDND